MARHQLSFSNERLLGGVLFKGFGRASAQSSPLLKMPRRQMQTFSFRAAFCVRFTPAIRFYWDVLAFVRACHTFLSGCLMFDHACCLPPVRQTERLAICFVPVPPWVVIAIRAFSDVAWLSGFVGSLRACAFLYGDPDGERKGTRGTESAARRSAFLRDHIGFAAFSAGSTLGLRAPDCAKETCLPGLSSFGS